MQNAFRFVALSGDQFAPLFSLDDGELRARDIRQRVSDAKPGYPCRVSLADAEPGESLLLLPFVHHPADSPYRASGPIFVRENAVQSTPVAGEVPEMLRSRLLSVRAYEAGGMMVEADVCEGRALEAQIGRMFMESHVAFLHVHNARTGCYFCRVDRE